MRDLLDFLVLLIVYIVFLYKKWRIRGKAVLFINTTVYIYIAFVLYFTLMPVIASLPFLFDHPYARMNLVPFIDVLKCRGDYTRQIVLNIVMTIPLGFLLPLTKRRYQKFGHVVLCAFLLSLGIELVQPLLSGGRSSDITDIITNVAGSALGYGLYLLFRPLTERILQWLQKK